MTKYVVLGHGGFDPTSVGGYPPEVLVPPGVKLYFYSNVGQALVLSYQKTDPYQKTANAWSQLKTYGSPLADNAVTYNFTLTPDTNAKEFESGNTVNWGDGVEVIDVFAGAKYLCQGAVDTCPTPKLRVAQRLHGELTKLSPDAVSSFRLWALLGDIAAEPDENFAEFVKANIRDDPELKPYLMYIAEGVPPQAWTHHCQGILGEYGSSGNEIHWIACTSILLAKDTRGQPTTASQPAAAFQREMSVLDTAATAGPGFDTSTWTPARDGNGKLDANNKDKASLRSRNADNIRATPSKGTLNVAVGGDLVLVGPSHDASPAAYVSRQNDFEEGQIKVEKFTGKVKSLTVSGLKTPASQELVESELFAMSVGGTVLVEGKTLLS
jgi:hypothetical protein